MYIPNGSTLYFGNKSPAGIFGYLMNSGNMSMQENAQLYFLGKIWMNDSTAKITNETTVTNSAKGGRINFYQPNPVFGNLGQQILHSSYIDTTRKGPSFSNITVDNNAGLTITSDVNVINNVQFKRGHVYLNNYTFVLGDTLNLGRVSGYDESRYFVTGAASLGGYLKYRSVLSGAMAAFPIGPTTKNYSPLQIVNRGSNDDFYGRAFEKVFSNATSGTNIIDSTLQVTWELGKSMIDDGEVAVTLQHDIVVEDPLFKTHRDKSFISLYDTGKWDKPNFFTHPPTPGSISSSFSIYSAMMNSRKFVLKNKPLFMTKKVGKGNKTFTIPNVFSPNGDNINDKWNIRGLKDFDNCVVEIFNRYGQMIFRSIGYNQPWDGTYKGNAMPVATYYYIIDLKNGERPIGGSVTILR
jgi:gliding motility-associated-like protein